MSLSGVKRCPVRDTWVRPKPASSTMRSISASAGAGELRGRAKPARTQHSGCAGTATEASTGSCSLTCGRVVRRRRGIAGAGGGRVAFRTGRGAGDWLARLQMSARSLPVATSLLHHPAHELGKRHSGVRGQLRNERGRRHARLRIHFQAHQLARAARRCRRSGSPPAKRRGSPMLYEPSTLTSAPIRKHSVKAAPAAGGREPPSRVLGLVVVEAQRLGRDDLGDAQHAVAHHGAGQLASGDVALGQQLLAERPARIVQLLRADARGPRARCRRRRWSPPHTGFST